MLLNRLRFHQVGFSSLMIEEFRHSLNRIPEYRHFEEHLWRGRHNSRQNRWLQWPRSPGRSSIRSVFGPIFEFFPPDWPFFSLVLRKIQFSAEAIFASSTSKFGTWIPLTEHEDFRSSTESTNSTSLIQGIVSVRNCEQVRTSVLNLFFQQANVAGVVNLLKWISEICSRCWSAR